MGQKTHAHKHPGDNTIKVPVVPGVIYKINDKVVSGEVTISESTTLTAEPAPGYTFPENAETSWRFVWKDKAPE